MWGRWLRAQAALTAPLPAGCSRTVYLCDDGRDRRKRKWCLSMSPDVVYVCGRQRRPGEMNGKSANLNNCLNQIYPAAVDVPANEIVCIFDADQVCCRPGRPAARLPKRGPDVLPGEEAARHAKQRSRRRMRQCGAFSLAQVDWGDSVS